MTHAPESPQEGHQLLAAELDPRVSTRPSISSELDTIFAPLDVQLLS